ncbi:MAG: cytochrome b/b6 domain-containing protein [Chloroflexi bacterium]|nr:cytochrome b/b6 domain-containing protein [Chloroflexota bacterium]
MEAMVERYRKPTRILHWVHAGAFTVLFLTGLILFVPGLGVLAQDSWTRILHRAAAVVFIVAPLIYIPMNWKATVRGIKDAFTWGPEDLGWLQAAPSYYFLADEKAMPPQGHMNTGQKMWWLMAIVFGLLFVATGIIMWLFKATLPGAAFLWAVFVHDVSFIAAGNMFFVHVYLSVAHPLMRPLSQGAWASMSRGKVPVEYVKSHHAKWYDEEARGKEIATIGNRR